MAFNTKYLGALAIGFALCASALPALLAKGNLNSARFRPGSAP